MFNYEVRHKRRMGRGSIDQHFLGLDSSWSDPLHVLAKTQDTKLDKKLSGGLKIGLDDLKGRKILHLLGLEL